MEPSQKNSVVLTVVWFVGVLAMIGLLGTIYLCHLNTNPELVAAAVKMIQTDPSSAMAALNLLRADASIIAIVSGLTGVLLGSLNGMLNNTRTHNEDSDVKQITKSSTETTEQQPKPEPIPPTPVNP